MTISVTTPTILQHLLQFIYIPIAANPKLVTTRSDNQFSKTMPRINWAGLCLFKWELLLGWVRPHCILYIVVYYSYQMALKTLAVAALAATSYASPLIQSRVANTSYTNSNGLTFSQFNHSRPNVTLLATGTVQDFAIPDAQLTKQAVQSPAQATTKPQQPAMNPAH